MIQPFFAFADFGFFLLRLFVGLLFFEEGLKMLGILFHERRREILPWVIPSTNALFGFLFITGTVTQLVALAALVFIIFIRPVRESLFPSVRTFGLFIISLIVLMVAGGGMLSFDRFFGLILY